MSYFFRLQGIKIYWLIQFLGYLKTLNLKQKARTKIEVVLTLQFWSKPSEILNLRSSVLFFYSPSIPKSKFIQMKSYTIVTMVQQPFTLSQKSFLVGLGNGQWKFPRIYKSFLFLIVGLVTRLLSFLENLGKFLKVSWKL